ncbi:MAG: hypothetical protein H7Y07_01840 [Pyrinomonadaceae bacterium]|nr:hypothetical protein [Sphingobacteriaceae bacterium]
MKNKWLTYFLGSVVLSVWGIIFYKIFNSLGDEDKSSFLGYSNSLPKEEMYDYSSKDTSNLSLNYKDPFRITSFKTEPNEQITSFKKRSRTIKQKKVTKDISVIYSGYIGNIGSQKLLTMVTINGKNEIMRVGETIGKIKLLKNYKDSIKISQSGKVTYVRLQ